MISLTSSTPVYLAHSTFLLKYSATCFDGICELWIGLLVPPAFTHFLLFSLGFYLLSILLLGSSFTLYPPQPCSTFRTRSQEMIVVCITYRALNFFQFITSCVLESSLCRTLGTYFCLTSRIKGIQKIPGQTVGSVRHRFYSYSELSLHSPSKLCSSPLALLIYSKPQTWHLHR